MEFRARMRSLARDGFGRLAGGLARAAPHGASLGKGVVLARTDAVTARAWLGGQAAVRAALGEEVAEAWGDLLVAAVRVDVGSARALALELPDLLAALPVDQRARALRVLAGVIRTRAAAAPLVARLLGEPLRAFDDATLAPFLARALALHAESPGAARAFLARETREGRAVAQALTPGLPFEAVARTLALYARAHAGMHVEVRAAAGERGHAAFTDGHHVYVPDRVDTGSPEDDFRVYRVQTALAVGYLEHGTFTLQLEGLSPPEGGAWVAPREAEPTLLRFFRSFPNGSLARDLFQVYEDARVEAAIRRNYPGVARDLDALGAERLRGEGGVAPGGDAPVPRILAAFHRAAWGLGGGPALGEDDSRIVAALVAEIPGVRAGTVRESALAVTRVYARVASRMLQAGEGGERAGRVRTPRPGGGGAGTDPTGEGNEGVPSSDPHARLRPERASAEDARVDALAQRYLRELQGEPGRSGLADARERAREAIVRGDPDADVAAMERSLERLGARGLRGATMDAGVAVEREPSGASGMPLDTDVEPGAVVAFYPEWDTLVGDLRPDWTCVREQRVREGDRAWVDEVRAAERPRILALRRRFQAMRADGLGRVRGELDGEDIDMDRALAETLAARAGHVREGRVHVRTARTRRDVAVGFLVDLSSSTNESADGSGRRILDVEKAALVVASEAMAALGDPFAIWGFSGYGRSHVAFYEAKGFHEAWDDRAARRVGRLNFKMENRDGAAIRHATAKLLRQPAQARLLVLLSDGKPLDCGCDHYHDRYAQDDTRAALREARRAGVRAYCVTVDPTGPRYLPRMYGDVAWTVIDRVDQLPDRLARALQGLLR